MSRVAAVGSLLELGLIDEAQAMELERTVVPLGADEQLELGASEQLDADAVETPLGHEPLEEPAIGLGSAALDLLVDPVAPEPSAKLGGSVDLGGGGGPDDDGDHPAILDRVLGRMQAAEELTARGVPLQEADLDPLIDDLGQLSELELELLASRPSPRPETLAEIERLFATGEWPHKTELALESARGILELGHDAASPERMLDAVSRGVTRGTSGLVGVVIGVGAAKLLDEGLVHVRAVDRITARAELEDGRTIDYDRQTGAPFEDWTPVPTPVAREFLGCWEPAVRDDDDGEPWCPTCNRPEERCKC